MQFAEGLSDRQAAEAVRARIDWKYALGLELTDAGFDYSVLSLFRRRLVEGGAEAVLLDALLEACTARGYLRLRGRQRTDATHILGVLRVLNRLECVAETLRAALNVVAEAAPQWLQQWAPAEWFERYSRRIEDYRLPKGKDARQAYAEVVGADGLRLLTAVYAPTAPPAVQTLPAVEILRRTWIYHYQVVAGQVRLRDIKDMPPVATRMESPYEPEARYGEKRGRGWTGYKVHVSESCDDDAPHLLTHVETTVAPATDVKHLAVIHEGLAGKGLLPAQHYVDAGYVRGQNLTTSQDTYGVTLIGPMYEDRRWQARTRQGYDQTQFQIDWAAHRVRCPQGRDSVGWSEAHTRRGRTMIHVRFAPADCAACAVRPLCTRSARLPRTLTLQPHEVHQAVRAARQRQQSAGFAAEYARRAGIEGTLSQGVRAFGLRQARYRGVARTHLQHVGTAAAINLTRLSAWLESKPRARTRTSHFAALALAS